MPEIAEVEIQRRGIEAAFRGQKLQEIEIEPRFGAAPQIQKLRGQSLRAVLRHGKLLGLEFDRDLLAVHLRMTGGFFLKEMPHTRARFRFQDTLFFADPRGFATIDLNSWHASIASLGPDLWSITAHWLPSERARSSRRAVKATILDQGVLAGIGNYLADESLYRARISPFTETRLINKGEWKRIISAAQDLSREVLREGGVSLRDYRNLSGEDGQGMSLLLVYGRAGSPCPRCGALLQKDRVQGRGTTWCPSCQG